MSDKLNFFLAGVSSVVLLRALWARFQSWRFRRTLDLEFGADDFDLTLPWSVTDKVMEILTPQQQDELRGRLSPDELAVVAEYLGAREERLAKKKIIPTPSPDDAKDVFIP
jgi:hypothetical protein